MFVGGMGVAVISTMGKTASVQSFSPDVPPLEIPIVDMAMLYDCPYSGCTKRKASVDVKIMTSTLD